MRVAALYLGIPAPLIVTDPPSAELIKYASNAFLAAKVSFVNAVAAVCEAVGADMNDVVLGMGSDKRIGHEFLRPGPGWGGSCFPKDSRALIRIAEDAGYSFDLLEGVVEVNDEQFDRVARKAIELAGGSVDGVQVAVWGLTFKARTDDLRESPSLSIVERLLAAGRQDPRLRPVDHAAGRAAQGIERSTASRSPAIRTPRARAPRCCSCSPSGTSSSGSTSTRSPRSLASLRDRRRPQPARP